MPVRVDPLPDASLIFCETFANEILGGAAVGVGGSGGDILFPTKTLAEVVVGSSYVLLESVAAVSFVGGEVARAGVLTGTVFIRLRLGGLARAGAGRENKREQKGEMDERPQEDRVAGKATND